MTAQDWMPLHFSREKVGAPHTQAIKVPDRLTLSSQQLHTVKWPVDGGYWGGCWPRSMVPLYYNFTRKLVFRNSD